MQMLKGGKNSGVFGDCGVGGKNRGANRKVGAGDFNGVKGDKENRLNLIKFILSGHFLSVLFLHKFWSFT